MNMIQVEAGLIPSIVKKENRAEYIKSLSESQDREDSSMFLDFMTKHHSENLLQQIEEYKQSMERDIFKSEKKKSRDNDYERGR